MPDPGARAADGDGRRQALHPRRVPPKGSGQKESEGGTRVRAIRDISGQVPSCDSNAWPWRKPCAGRSRLAHLRQCGGTPGLARWSFCSTRRVRCTFSRSTPGSRSSTPSPSRSHTGEAAATQPHPHTPLMSSSWAAARARDDLFYALHRIRRSRTVATARDSVLFWKAGATCGGLKLLGPSVVATRRCPQRPRAGGEYVGHVLAEVCGVNLPALQLQLAMGVPLRCIPQARSGEARAPATEKPRHERHPAGPLDRPPGSGRGGRSRWPACGRRG